MNYCGTVSPAYHTSTCHHFTCRPLCIFYPGIFIKIPPAFIPTNTAFLVPTPPANHLSPKPGDRPATSPMTEAGLLVQRLAPVCLSVCPVCLLVVSWTGNCCTARPWPNEPAPALCPARLPALTLGGGGTEGRAEMCRAVLIRAVLGRTVRYRIALGRRVRCGAVPGQTFESYLTVIH